MPLVRVFWPQSESEVLVAISLLEARQIPAFIHNRGIGSILPGVQINAYNTQSILVPAEQVADALELLAELRDPPRDSLAPLPLKDKVRIFVEWLLFAWFVPGTRSRRTP